MSYSREVDATKLLQELIRFESINPPGRERDCIEHIAGYVRVAGVTPSLHAQDPERPNLVSSLRQVATS